MGAGLFDLDEPCAFGHAALLELLEQLAGELVDVGSGIRSRRECDSAGCSCRRRLSATKQRPAVAH